jgi:hypothetical protein
MLWYVTFCYVTLCLTTLHFICSIINTRIRSVSCDLPLKYRPCLAFRMCRDERNLQTFFFQICVFVIEVIQTCNSKETEKFILNINIENQNIYSCLVTKRRQNNNTKTTNISFENVKKFKHFGMRVTNQSYIHKQVMSRSYSRNAYYCSFHSLLSSGFLSKNLKIKICEIIILHFVLYECDTWSFTLRK